MSDAQRREQQFDAAAESSLADGSLSRRTWDALTDRLAELSTEGERDRAMRTLFAVLTYHRERMRRADGALRRRRKEQLADVWTAARSLVGSYAMAEMKLFVRLPHLMTMVIDIARDATLFELKCQIQDKCGLRPCEQRVGDGSTVLEDDAKSLWHYCTPSQQNPLVPECTLHLTLRCADFCVFWGSYSGLWLGQCEASRTLEESCVRVAELSRIPVGQQLYRLSRTGPFVARSSSLAELTAMQRALPEVHRATQWWPLYASSASTRVFVLSTMDRLRCIARVVGMVGAWRARAAHRVYSPLCAGYAQAEASFLASASQVVVAVG